MFFFRKFQAFGFLLLLSVTITPVASGAEPKTTETLAPGLEHHVFYRGEADRTKKFRISFGPFERQSEAGDLLERLSSSGFFAFPESDGSDYWIVTPAYALRCEAEVVMSRIDEGGFSSPMKIQEIDCDPNQLTGPWRIHVLEADPKKIEIRVAHAYDSAIGLETTAGLATRHGALAAINGGYFRMKGMLAGDSQGALQIAGRVLSEPDRGRGAVGYFDRDGTTISIFGRLSFRGEVHFADGDVISIDGINRHRTASEIVLFTPEFHRTTLTSPSGAEVVISNGHIAEIRDGSGSSVIPAGGMVLSIGGERSGELLPRLRRGQELSVELDLLPLLPDPDSNWQKTTDILAGGPLLIWRGKRLDEPEKESISRVFYRARHPRTAVGVRADGTLLFVTVDGRQPGKSAGMSIPELSDLMLELGSVYAINLDGGGSTTMVIDGKMVNTPPGSKGARRNGDALLLFAK